MTMFVARCVSTVRNSSATSKCRLSSETTVPPVVMAMNAENCPVPCISGQATTITTGAGASGSSRSATSATDSAGGVPSSGLPPLPNTLNRSSWRHITPFGIPVVPPVYSSKRSSPLRPHVVSTT